MKKKYFYGFNGLRTFAITMVIACHVGLLSSSSGGIGNKIFFCLSGFLAYFSLENISSIKDILSFYAKKILRIIPSYYILMLLVAIIFPGCIFYSDFSTSNSLILNMFFIKNFGHLWFLQQIMLMYLVAPVLYCFFIIIRKAFLKIVIKTGISDIKMFISHILSAITMLVLGYIEKRYLTAEVFQLSGEGSHAQFALWIFIIGFSFAIIYDGCMNMNFDETIFSSHLFKILSNIYIVAFFTLLILFVIPNIHDNYTEVSAFFDSDIVRSFLAGFAIFLLAINSDTILTKILDNKLFNLISDISFEVYIIHFFLLSCFYGISVKRYFIAIYIFSICIGYCVHTLTKRLTQKHALQGVNK